MSYLKKMTKKSIIDLCIKNKLYRTPHLNETLYLHFQGFSDIENLEEYTELKCLWLESNAISDIKGLENLKKLKCLFLQNNLINKIENLQNCQELDTINLCHNRIKKIENCGIDVLPILNTLNISHNSLRKADQLEGLKECNYLSVLDISHNKIEDVTIVKILSQMPQLRVLCMIGNPVVNLIPSYRKTLILECNGLTYLDNRPVFPKDRACAEAWKRGGFTEEQKEHRQWIKAANKKTRDSVNALLALRKPCGEQTELIKSSDEEEEEQPRLVAYGDNENSEQQNLQAMNRHFENLSMELSNCSVEPTQKCLSNYDTKCHENYIEINVEACAINKYNAKIADNAKRDLEDSAARTNNSTKLISTSNVDIYPGDPQLNSVCKVERYNEIIEKTFPVESPNNYTSFPVKQLSIDDSNDETIVLYTKNSNHSADHAVSTKKDSTACRPNMNPDTKTPENANRISVKKDTKEHLTENKNLLYLNHLTSEKEKQEPISEIESSSNNSLFNSTVFQMSNEKKKSSQVKMTLSYCEDTDTIERTQKRLFLIHKLLQDIPLLGLDETQLVEGDKSVCENLRKLRTDRFNERSEKLQQLVNRIYERRDEINARFDKIQHFWGHFKNPHKQMKVVNDTDLINETKMLMNDLSTDSKIHVKSNQIKINETRQEEIEKTLVDDQSWRAVYLQEPINIDGEIDLKNCDPQILRAIVSLIIEWSVEFNMMQAFQFYNFTQNLAFVVQKYRHRLQVFLNCYKEKTFIDQTLQEWRSDRGPVYEFQNIFADCNVPMDKLKQLIMKEYSIDYDNDINKLDNLKRIVLMCKQVYKNYKDAVDYGSLLAHSNNNNDEEPSSNESE